MRSRNGSSSADFARIQRADGRRDPGVVSLGQEKSDKLWDGWLHVMEVLDKAQKLADRSGRVFSQKTLGEAEKLIEQQGSFRKS